MLRYRVIPVLLLRDRGLVKTVQFRNPTYVGDPINAVRIFNTKEVDELALLDITATMEKRKPHFDLIGQIASECFMPLAYGGGLNTLDDIKTIFGLGIEKVVLNTALVTHPGLVQEAATLYGSQSIVASVDVQKNWWGTYEVKTRSATKKCQFSLLDYVRRVQELGAGEILVNSVDRDGTMKGYDTELLKAVSSAASVPVIGCGGAGKLQDLQEAVQKTRVSALAAGSMFVFQGVHRAVLIQYPTQQEIRSYLG